MAIQNYNQVVDALNQFANAHLTIKRFKTSFFEQIDNFATANNSFPILYAIPEDVSFEDEIDVMTFRVYCVDILQKDRSNEQSILNETLLVLRDLVNWIRMTDTLDLNVVGTPRAIPVNNFLTEFTVGFYIDISVETSPETNDCSIPFSYNFQYTGITCDYNYIKNYLTCETLDACQTIIDIESNIRILSAITETYVTGFTYNDANRLTLSQNAGKPNLSVFINNFTGFTTNYVDINTAVTIPSIPGRLTWNDIDGTLDLGLKGGIIKSQLGQGLVTRVVNKTTPNIPLSGSNYQVVVVSGAQGQRLAIKLAQADNDANSAGTLGIVAEDIAKNQEGFIVTVGLLKNINTTGNLQGENWNDGDILYLSPTTAGAITNIKPKAPQHTVIVGYVEYAHQNNGKIYVKIDNGYELDELHNVRITGVTNNQILAYNGSLSAWTNTTLPAYITGFTDTFTTGFTFTNNNTLTISQNQGQQPLPVTINNLTLTGLTVNGTVTATSLNGSGSNLTGVAKTPLTSLGNGTNVTGTTSNTFCKAMLVPANSMVVNDAPIINARVFKTGINGTILARVYWNTTPDTSGTPILLGTSSGNAATTRSFTFTRMLSIEVANGTGNGTVTHGVNSSNNSDNGPFGGAISTGLAIDWTQTGYIVVALSQGSASDTSNCNSIKLNV